MPRRSARTLGASAVFALHVLGLVALMAQPRGLDRSPARPVQPPIWLRLLRPAQPPTPRAAVAPPLAPPVRPTVRPIGRGITVAPALQALTAPATTPSSPAASASESPAATAAPTPVAANPSATQAAAPLNLDLPRAASAAWRQRPLALDDLRANTARATFEEKLAAALGGDGVWQEEKLDNDRTRFRRGNTCVEVQRSREAQLDPTSDRARSLPWQAKAPKPC